MERRKDNLIVLKLCRFCLSQDETLTTLYDSNRTPRNSVPLGLKILSCVSIEVFPSDKMLSYICSRCKFFMDICYDFKQMCRQADENVIQYIQTGNDLNTVTCPSSLQKLFRAARISTPGLTVMKTVVEGGATVQVTAQGSDSEEDDDENVYNVKIGDGSEGPKSARVKVVSNSKQNKGKAKEGKGFTTAQKLTKHVRGHAGDRAYPCKFCDKSFIKSHHYTRHLRVKHREAIRTARGPFGESTSKEQFRCEQCEDMFATQDELIYHSAIHATQNLVCPLCQEKFEDVDAVTSHIKSHVNGTEFMCDLCELVFTTKEKLDNHINNAHGDELREEEGQDESSLEADEAEEDEDESAINIKEEDGNMVVEIKKADEFMLPNLQSTVLKGQHTNFEESDSEMTFADLATLDTLTVSRADAMKTAAEKTIAATPGGAVLMKTTAVPAKNAEKSNISTASILRRAEEVKRKAQSTSDPVPEKKSAKVESNNTGASDKSLRLLEKELQELKRTNTRSEVAKTPAKPVETLRSKRPQIHTSTPKLRATAVEEKKPQVPAKAPVVEKKRIVTKENKEPKDAKEVKGNNGNGKEEVKEKEKDVKEREKDVKEKEKEVKEKEKDVKEKEKDVKEKEKDVKEKEKDVKEKETPKNSIKNGTTEKSPADEGIRRSTRPSKIKDYAKMIRDRAQESDNEDDSDEAEEEYKAVDKTIEKRKSRRSAVKPSPKAATPAPVVAVAATPTPRKRGRPRKDAEVATPTPSKVKKEDKGEDDSDNETKPKDNSTPSGKNSESTTDNGSLDKESKSPSEGKAAPGLVMSPTGQTLKKVPVKALPPGIKPLPLPARTMAGGEVCEMQIGKKVVKVQKIVMTKAEVEAMAKRGLVEMKDGTMVLKQGIKLPTSDPSAIKNLVGDEAAKESPSKAAPTRCEMEEDT